MLLHNGPLFRIYFGNAQDNLYPNMYLNLPVAKHVLDIKPFVALRRIMHIDSLIFLRQVHSNQGIALSAAEAATLRPFSCEGDFLITDVPLVGIGVMTADCLPIVMYDNVNNVIAIAHAGWQGSVNGVARNAVERMCEIYGSEPEHIRVFFGPSAKVCCYTVTNDFLRNLEKFSEVDRVIQRHDGKNFFDLPLFNKLQLESIGIKKEAFRLEYNICTICDKKFFSFRRQGQKAGRQMTVVSLK